MKSYLYAIGAILCWASLPAATGSGLKSLGTEELLFYSFASAAIFLYLQDILLLKKVKLSFLPLKESLFGFSGIFFYHFFYYKAMENAPIAECAILATTWSFWIVVFSSTIKFKKLKLTIILTAIVGLIGAIIVISSGHNLNFSSTFMIGYVLALSCGLIWSSFTVALPYFKMNDNPMTLFTIYSAIASGILFIATMPHPTPDLESLLSAIYLGVVPLGLSFYLWNKALESGNVTIIGFLSYFTPPLAVLLVVLIHGERLSSQVIVGMFVILLASIMGKYMLGKGKIAA